jgi:hypothetical protein
MPRRMPIYYNQAHGLLLRSEKKIIPRFKAVDTLAQTLEGWLAHRMSESYAAFWGLLISRTGIKSEFDKAPNLCMNEPIVCSALLNVYYNVFR